jgi:hypothetical protein
MRVDYRRELSVSVQNCSLWADDCAQTYRQLISLEVCFGAVNQR